MADQEQVSRSEREKKMVEAPELGEFMCGILHNKPNFEAETIPEDDERALVEDHAVRYFLGGCGESSSSFNLKQGLFFIILIE